MWKKDWPKYVWATLGFGKVKTTSGVGATSGLEGVSSPSPKPSRIKFGRCT